MLEESYVLADVELEFAFHLTIQESFEYILREGVSDNLLNTPRVKSIYRFVQHHYNETGKIPTLPVLRIEFPSFDFRDPETTIFWVVERLKTRFKQNRVEELVTELAKKQSVPDEAMSFLRQQFVEIERDTMSERNVWSSGDYKIFIKSMQEKILEGHFKGVSIGFDEIDHFTGGIKPGNLSYIGARMKRQKTFFLLKAFIQQVKDGNRPMLFTLENTSDEMMMRISCMISGFPWDRMYRGDMMNKDWKIITSAWEEFESYGKFWIESPPLDERTVPALMLKADKMGAESVLISQFKYIRGLRDWYPGLYEEPAEVAVDLKRAATRPGCERPILVEAQFNRGGDSMDELEDFNPSKVGLTDMVLQACDSFYGIFQSKDMRDNNQSEFGILEARNHGRRAWQIYTNYVETTIIELIEGSGH